MCWRLQGPPGEVSQLIRLLQELRGHPDNNDDPRRWGRHWQTWGGGSLVRGGGMGGFGAQHSQSLETWLTHIPGIKVVYASNPVDAKGLLLSARP